MYNCPFCPEMYDCTKTYRRLLSLLGGMHAVSERCILFVRIVTIELLQSLFALEAHIFEIFSCEKSISSQDQAAYFAFVTTNTLN